MELSITAQQAIGNEIVSLCEDSFTTRRTVERQLNNCNFLNQSYDYEDPSMVDRDDLVDEQGREFYRLVDYMDSLRVFLTGKCKDPRTDDKILKNLGKLFNPYSNGSFPENMDYFLKLIQDVGLLTYDLIYSEERSDYIRAISVFIMLRTKGPIINSKMIFLLKDKFTELFTDYLPQSSGLFSDFKDFLKSYTRLKESALYKKLYKFLMYVVSLSIFDKIGVKFNSTFFTKVQEEAIKKKYHLGPDFIHTLLDTITFVCERGYQCMMTGSMDPLYHNGKNYEQWFLDVAKLKRDSLCLTNPAAHGINLFEFKANLDAYLEKGVSMLKYMSAEDKSERRFILSEMNSLELIKADLVTKAAAGKERVPPWSCLLNAPPGNGKSTFSSILFYYYAALHDMPNGTEYKYTRNPADKFWSAFKSSMWFCVLDDIASLLPSKSLGVDPSLAELIQIRNQVAVVPPQAELADKGKTPILFEVLVATTNIENLNAYAYFACPLAIQRRLPWIIRVLAKPEYAKHDIMLDASKVPLLEIGRFPDYWNIEVLKIVPATNSVECKHGRAVSEKLYTCIDDFLVWFGQETIKYKREESVVLDCTKVMSQISICKFCMKCTKLCFCDVGESKSDDEKFNPTVFVNGVEDNIDHFIDKTDIKDPEFEIFEIASTGGEDTYTENDSDDDSVAYDLQSTDIPPQRINFSMCATLARICAVFGLVVPLYKKLANIDFYQRTSKYIRTKFQEDTEKLKNNQPIFHNVCGQAYRRTIDGLYERYPKGDRIDMRNSVADATSFFVERKAQKSWLAGKYVDYFNIYLGEFFAYIYLEWGGYSHCITWAYKFPILGYYFRKWCQSKTSDSRVLGAVFKRLGKKVEQRIGRVPLLITIVSIITASGLAVYASVNFFKWFFPSKGINKQPINRDIKVSKVEKVIEITPSKQSVDSTTIGVALEPQNDEKINIYYNDNYNLSAIDLTPQSTSMSTQSLDEREKFESRILRNCVYLKCHWISDSGEALVRPNAAVCIEGHVYVVNSHGIPLSDSFDLEILREPLQSGLSANTRFRVNQSRFKRIANTDYCFFLLLEDAPRKRITSYFCKDSLRGKFTGKYIGKNRKGESFSKLVHNIYFNPSFESTLGVHPMWKGRVDIPTEPGDCGSLLLTWTDMGPVLLGIHAAGNNPNHGVGALWLCQSVLKQGLSLFEPQVCGTDINLSLPGFPQKLTKLNKKSPVRYLDSGVAEVYGTLEGFRAHPTSRVEPTFIQQSMLDLGYKVRYGAPLMKGWKPWYLALEQMTKPVRGFDPILYHQCVDAFADDILKGLDKKYLKELVILDDFSTLNGIAGTAYIDSINKSTSMGFPIKSSKRGHLVKLPAQRGFEEPHEYDQVTKDEINRILDCYHRGERAYPIGSASLKDEPKTFVKIDAGKTRVFVAEPAAWCFVVRKYLLSFLRIVRLNQQLFEAAPGIRAQSDEWGRLRSWLVKYGEDKMIAGDYKNFDKSMPPVAILGGFHIIMRICRVAGWSDSDLMILRCISEDIAYPIVDINGDLVQLLCSNPSGQPLTVDVNDFSGSGYFRYAFVKITALSPSVFKDYVSMVNYGDDNAASSKHPKFNHTNIQKVLAEVGIGYTMADKEAESVPFIHIDDVSFLKRKFVYDNDVGEYLAPLEEESIEKMLTVCVKSKSICPEAQSIAVISTAVREYFFYGKKIFNEKRLAFEQVIDNNATLKHYKEDSTLPTWDELVEQFKMNSFKAETSDFPSGSMWGPIVKPKHKRISELLLEDRLASFLLEDGINKLEKLPKFVEGVATLNILDRLQKTNLITELPPFKVEHEKRVRCPTIIHYYERRMSKQLTQFRAKQRELKHTYFMQSEDTISSILDNYVLFTSIADVSNDEAMRILKPMTYKGDLYVFVPHLVDYAQFMHTKRTRDRMRTKTISFRQQSEDAPSSTLQNTAGGIENPKPAQTTEQVVEFLDENEGFETGFKSMRDPTSDADMLPMASLQDFLSRPVRIATIPWLESDVVGYNAFIRPWQLFFNDDRIRRKLDNFSFLRCNLKVKVLLNASPFYYGAMLQHYHPLPTLKPTTIVTDANYQYFIPFSQRPHSWLYPANSEGSVMTLPFFFNKNWLNNTQNSDFVDMGILNFTAFTELRSANGVTGTGVTLQVYAWAEDVEVSGPTVAYAMQTVDFVEQTKDEYGKSSVSNIASAIASAAGALSRIPMISRYATATQMGAQSVSNAANALGFCNTPVIEDINPLKPVAFPPLSTSDIGYPIEKLTLDAKNELSVDPGVAGLKGVDELNVSYLCQKESYLCSVPWLTTDTTDTILSTFNVSPQQITLSDAPVKINSTPQGYLSMLFKYWRGGQIYRFKIVSSPYHKGRVRLTWDPTGTSSQNILNTAGSQPVTFTKVIDLGKDTDVEFHVPYHQSLGFSRLLETDLMSAPYQIGPSPTWTRVDGCDNGLVTLRVVTPLTAPIVTAPVNILVSVRAASDIEFTTPIDLDRRISPWVQQSADMFDMGDSVLTSAGPSVPKEPKERFLVYFGEAIVNLRQLMRRSTLNRIDYFVTSTSIGGNLLVDRMTRFPIPNGYDPLGFDRAPGLTVPASTFNYNYTFPHPYTHISQAFIGTRGSMMVHYNVSDPIVKNSVRISRTVNSQLAVLGVQNIVQSFTTANNTRYWYNINSFSGACGQALTAQRTQSGISVVIPNFSPFKFQSTRPSAATSPQGVDGANYETVTVEMSVDGNTQTTTPIKIWKYYSIGTDLNLLFFLNTPTLFRYPSVPVAV